MNNTLKKTNLDKYYTKIEIAKICFEKLEKVIYKYSDIFENVLFVEPSAGNGSFLNAMSATNKIGFDIVPEDKNIIKNNFLTEDFRKKLNNNDLKKHFVFIGNPPFGIKSSLAIAFLNKTFEYSDITGFIVPLQFRKWSVQNHINKNAKLILDLSLPENSFVFGEKDYKLRCCFQIWTTNSLNHEENIRIVEKPKTTHQDFKAYQYNRTKEAEKFFDYDWDFAVPRQGFLNYNMKSYTKDDCNKKQQWIFFKAKNKKVLKKLLNIDFVKLSKKNTGIPGFGKADVVEEYSKTIDNKQAKLGGSIIKNDRTKSKVQ